MSVVTAKPGQPLSKGEQEVLVFMALGWSNQQISEQRFIAQTTVASRVRNILAKLGASNRTHAVHIAHCEGLLR